MGRQSGALLLMFCCLLLSTVSYSLSTFGGWAEKSAAYGREPEFSRKARGQKSRKWHIERASESRSIDQAAKGRTAELVPCASQSGSTRTFGKTLHTQNEDAEASCRSSSGFEVGERRVCDYEGGISVTRSIAWTVQHKDGVRVSR